MTSSKRPKSTAKRQPLDREEPIGALAASTRSSQVRAHSRSDHGDGALRFTLRNRRWLGATRASPPIWVATGSEFPVSVASHNGSFVAGRPGDPETRAHAPRFGS
jgi:hypothetical protein